MNNYLNKRAGIKRYGKKVCYTVYIKGQPPRELSQLPECCTTGTNHKPSVVKRRIRWITTQTTQTLVL